MVFSSLLFLNSHGLKYVYSVISVFVHLAILKIGNRPVRGRTDYSIADYKFGRFTVFYSRPTESKIDVPCQVIRFHKSVLLIIHYKYSKSFSENFVFKNLILRTISCGTVCNTQLPKRQISAQKSAFVKWFVPQLYQLPRGILDWPALKYFYMIRRVRGWVRGYRDSLFRECARGCTNRGQSQPIMSTIDVTANTFFESLYLVLGLGTFGFWVNCPCTPTTPTVHATTISRFPCKFFPQMAPHFFDRHDLPSLAKSRYPRRAGVPGLPVVHDSTK